MGQSEVIGEAVSGLEREGAFVADEQFPGLFRFLLQFFLVIFVFLWMLRPGGNCIKIGLPRKLIISWRKGLQEVLFS